MLLIGRLIAYIEKHSYTNHTIQNIYIDKRFIVNSSYRVIDWVNFILIYKLHNNSIENLPKPVKNAINFIENPNTHSPILSEKCKSQISAILFKKKYNSNKFEIDMIDYFKEFKIIYNNEQNRLLYYSNILNDFAISSFWGFKEKATEIKRTTYILINGETPDANMSDINRIYLWYWEKDLLTLSEKSNELNSELQKIIDKTGICIKRLKGTYKFDINKTKNRKIGFNPTWLPEKDEDASFTPTNSIISDSDTYNVNYDIERKKVLQKINERKGQKKFRTQLLNTHNAVCMITGCIVNEILDAAHIFPYKSELDNHITNGLLLRTDIHTLFDLELLGIHPESLLIHLSKEIKDETYKQFIGKKVNNNGVNLNRNALKLKWDKFIQNQNSQNA